MVIKTFITSLEKEIREKLDEIEAKRCNTIIKTQEAIKYLESTFEQLKVFISDYNFKDESEEISFFKEIKPKLYSHLIYYRKIYNIQMKRPVGSWDIQRNYLSRELDFIKDFFDKNIGFYRYYRSGNTLLDKDFFLRGKSLPYTELESFHLDRDPKFSTCYDFKVAKMLANDRIEIFLKSELEELYKNNENNSQSDLYHIKHIWTADKIDLVELIYAFKAIGCIDYGNLSFKELAIYAEQMFNIDLSDAFQMYYDISVRENPAQFLDKMKEELIKKLENTNGK